MQSACERLFYGTTCSFASAKISTGAQRKPSRSKKSAVSLSKTAEMCLQILRKMKDQMRFCEHRANRYAIAKDYLETFLAEHGENKHHEEKEDEEEDGGRET